MQMMLIDNLIHSDLHPGNILVRLNPPASGLLSVVFEALDKVKVSNQVGATCRALEVHRDSCSSVAHMCVCLQACQCKILTGQRAHQQDDVLAVRDAMRCLAGAARPYPTHPPTTHTQPRPTIAKGRCQAC